MKTTIDLPDALFRQANTLAVARGVTFRQFFIEALEEQIQRRGGVKHSGNGTPPLGWPGSALCPTLGTNTNVFAA